MQILFLAHRLPYPPDKGERIRAYEEVRYLGEHHEVDLLCFADSERAAQEQTALAAICRRVHVEVLSQPSRLVRAAGSFATGHPSSFGFFYSSAFKQSVQQALRRQKYDAMFVYSSSMGQYVPQSPPVPIVVDFVDADSHKFEQYAAASLGLRACFFRREAGRVARAEQKLGRLAALSFAVTPHDALELEKCIGANIKVEVVPNGVQVREPGDAEPAGLADLSPFLLFVGTMSYPPNVDAVLYFTHSILPLIRKTFPAMKFVVVGRDPDRRVRALAAIPGVVVTGHVPDPFAYFRTAEASVAPFRISQGFHNKIAESLAVGTPVVTSKRAKAGIGLSEREGLFVADTTEEFAARLVSVVSPDLRHRLRQNAPAVRKMLSWDARLCRMEALIERAAAKQSGTQHELVVGR